MHTLTLVDPAFGTGRDVPLPLRIPGVATLTLTRGASVLGKGQLDDFVHPERYPDWVPRDEVQMRYKGFRGSIMDTGRGDVLKRPARRFTTLVRDTTSKQRWSTRSCSAFFDVRIHTRTDSSCLTSRPALD